jgi:hypothetical protein
LIAWGSRRSSSRRRRKMSMVAAAEGSGRRDAEAELNLPPGFRFHPTDEELVVHYLCRRVARQQLPVPIIAEVDLYKFDPWDLPGARRPPLLCFPLLFSTVCLWILSLIHPNLPRIEPNGWRF